VYYQDNNDVHKIYYEQDIRELGYDIQNLQVFDSVIVFREADYGSIWYRGGIHTEYNNKMDTYQVSGGIVAFNNPNGGVSAYVRGKVVEVTRQRVESFILKGNTIVLKFGPSSYSVWWNGRLFDF
jgi:hypothetical protein